MLVQQQKLNNLGPCSLSLGPCSLSDLNVYLNAAGV